MSGLSDTSLIRGTYRALLRSNRSYAAFTAADRLLIKRLSNSVALLDPMSGYGSLTHLAVTQGQSSFCLELNEPQFLWQVLTHPSSRETVLAAARLLRAQRAKANTTSCAIISESFFPEEAREVVRGLRGRVQRAIEDSGNSLNKQLVDAVILPFVGRLSCVRPSFNPAHVKRGGGICVLKDWDVDFRDYLDALIALLDGLPSPAWASRTNHGLAHGDARSFGFEPRAYDGLLTSPPYPNRADYASLFLPESDYLSWIREAQPPESQRLIGSVVVSHRNGAMPRASTALQFLDEADSHAKAHGKSAEYDQSVYYRPYFEEYFAGLEAAWRNVETALGEASRGFIVVVNNTHRGIVVPVAEFACEVWQGLGFTAGVCDTSEHTHVGTKNPRARGVRAIHSRYVIEIERVRP